MFKLVKCFKLTLSYVYHYILLSKKKLYIAIELKIHYIFHYKTLMKIENTFKKNTCVYLTFKVYIILDYKIVISHFPKYCVGL